MTKCNFVISYLTLRYNSAGYCAPSNVYLKEDYDHDGVWAEDYTSNVHLVGDGNDSAVKTWDFWQADDKTWLIYLPEYDNMGDDYCHIEVEKDETVYPIYFANYSDGFTDAYSEDETDLSDRYNVYRNCYYRFITELGGGCVGVRDVCQAIYCSIRNRRGWF